MEALVRRVPLRHGAAEVTIDKARGLVRVAVALPRLLWLTPARLDVLRVLVFVVIAGGGVALYLDQAASTAVASTIVGTAALWGIVEVLVALWGVDRRATPAIRVELATGRVLVGAAALPLGLVEVGVDEAQWRLEHRGPSVAIGDAWGGPGASWLQRTLDRLAEGRLHELDFPEARAPEPAPPAVPTMTIGPELVQTHEGVEAHLRARALQGIVSVLSPVVGMVAMAGVLLLIRTGDPPIARIQLFVALTGGLGLILSLAVAWQRRRLHRHLRIDTRSLAWTERGRTHEVPLLDIAAVHQTPATVQVVRQDGSAFTLGHGWPLEPRRRLHRVLSIAVAAAHERGEPPPRGSADELPGELQRLRDQRSSQ